ncbi:putative porin [Halochromatium glycolicum]|nr:putative porin [Halochromatium glycolicum]
MTNTNPNTKTNPKLKTSGAKQARAVALGLSLPLGVVLGVAVGQAIAPPDSADEAPPPAVGADAIGANLLAPIEGVEAAASSAEKPPSPPAERRPEQTAVGDSSAASHAGVPAGTAVTVERTEPPMPAAEAAATVEGAGAGVKTGAEVAGESAPVAPASVAPAAAHAAADGAREELLEIKHTITNLVTALVEQGVLSAAVAESIVEQAESKAAVRAAAETREARMASAPASGVAPAPAPAAAAPAVAETQEAPAARMAPIPVADAGAEGNAVRVMYVPEFIKEDIRNDVRAQLRADVTQDVLRHAKEERWGVPDALPDWIDRIKLYGDIRVRGQGDLFAEKNQPYSYPDWNAINDAGGVVEAGRDAFLNTTMDRWRARVRARLGLTAKVTNSVEAGFRLATGNEGDPISTNQTMGSYGEKYSLSLDLAYLKYTRLSDDGYPWMTLYGGRFKNPWYSTDLVWDSDLTFQGMAVTFRYNLQGSGNLFAMEDRTDTAFLTLGAFPLQEVELSSHDKWLYGAQLGTELMFENQSAFKAGVAYYSYQNIAGRRNEYLSTEYDWTAPEFVQKGNSMFDIRNDLDPSTNLYALAADYELVNLTAEYDFAQLAPIHVVLLGDYVRNIGFDENAIERRTGARIEARRDGWQLGLSVGWPKIDRRGNWRLFGAYKSLQRDAVLDAFTDSDFHLGGTDAKGFILGGEYGLDDNTWLSLRWLSANEIDGPPLGVDVLQLDLNAKF